MHLSALNEVNAEFIIDQNQNMTDSANVTDTTTEYSVYCS